MLDKLFDLRFVIGFFFSIVAILLLIQGFVFSSEGAQAINKGCGIAFLLFGVLMIILSFKEDATDKVLEHDDDRSSREI
jgi:hypothetical protein